MTRACALLALLTVCGAAVVASHQNPAPPQETFRASTELILLDVSVLDKARHAVGALTASDFTVLVDGRPTPIVAFKAVDVPPPDLAPSAGWIRDVVPDVATNIHPQGRVIAILIDDYSIGEARLGPAGVQKARQTALAVVDALGPDDRAAVVFTADGHTAQTFTTDRERLRKAIEGLVVFPEPPDIMGTGPGAQGFCACGVCAIRALDRVAQSLRSLSEQRKTVIYVSAGSIVPRPGPAIGCNGLKRDAMVDALRQAQLANVTIQAFDPTGLLPGASVPRIEFLRTMAESTGGRAVVNNNDVEQQVPAILAESQAYYLLGVAPSAAPQDGRFHPIRVRMNRGDVEVRTRNGYYDPTQQDGKTDAPADESRDFTPLIAEPMQRSGVPLALSAAPFISSSSGQPALVIALSVGPEADAGTRPTPRTEIVEMIASLFNPETGDGAGSRQERLSLTWRRPDPRFGYYEILSRLPVASGRYELRAGVKTGDGRTASLYTSVQVPNFDDDLALSGLVLNATPSPTVASADAVSDLLPLLPTSRRLFRSSDEAVAFLRIYQRTASFSAATVTTRLTSANDNVLANDTQRLEGETVGLRSSADYEVALPLKSLAAGEYLLTIVVTVGNEHPQRQLRFRVE